MDDINELEGQARDPDKRFCFRKTLHNREDFYSH